MSSMLKLNYNDQKLTAHTVQKLLVEMASLMSLPFALA